MSLSSHDIAIQTGKAYLYFRLLKWDTVFFGRPCYTLDPGFSAYSASKSLAETMSEYLVGAFVTAKIDTREDYGIVAVFQAAGFAYIETEITFEYCHGVFDDIATSDSVAIKRLHENTGLPYEKFGNIFSLTRFHTDPNIGSDKADLLWFNYLKNYSPDNTHHMYVATVKDDIAGVILVNESDECANIFYVAIAGSYQGRGIGSSLIRSVAENFRNRIVTTGTQARNVAAMNFYIKNGFRKIRSSKTVLHRW